MIELFDTNLTVSRVCLGTDIAGTSKGEQKFFEIMDWFVGHGGNFIDTANVYGRWLDHGLNCGEIMIGKWLKSRKKPIVVATKGGHYDLATRRKRITLADLTFDLDSSLKSLGLDCIDLYYLHRDDPDLPIGEIMEMMNTFVRAGKIRALGASNFSPERVEAANKYAAEHGIRGFSALSNQYSLARVNPGRNTNRDPSLWICDDAELAFHSRTGIPLIPYQATARGYFAKLAAKKPIPSGLSEAYDNRSNREEFERLITLSKETGKSVQTLSITEMVRRADFPLIPVVGVSRVEHLNDIFDAMEILDE